MISWLWRNFLKLIGYSKGTGRGNKKVDVLFQQNYSGWVRDVSGVVTWIKTVDEAEEAERRRRFWRHIWRSLLELFGAKANHKDRYPHQIFLIEVEDFYKFSIRIENNLYTGKEIDDLAKGDRLEIAGEYIPNDRGGKIHHTHGRRGYIRRRY